MLGATPSGQQRRASVSETEKTITMNKSRSSKEADKSLQLEKCVSEKPSDTLSIDSAAVVRSLFKVDETKRKNKSNFCTFIKQYKIFIWIQRIFLISICIAIVGGFTVPTIIYALNTDRGENKSLSSGEFNLDSCPNTTAQVRKSVTNMHLCIDCIYSVTESIYNLRFVQGAFVYLAVKLVRSTYVYERIC